MKHAFNFICLTECEIAISGIPCHDPANLETVEIESRCSVKVDVSKQFFKGHLKSPILQWLSEPPSQDKDHQEGDIVASLDFSQLQTVDDQHLRLPKMKDRIPVSGFVVMEDSSKIKVIHPNEISSVLGVTEHHMSFSCLCPIYPAASIEEEERDVATQVTSPEISNVRKDDGMQTPVDMEVSYSASSTQSSVIVMIRA